jgi:tetratricopeptide (TPR) repeat protein
LASLAGIVDDQSESLRLYNEAIERFKIAVKINPNLPSDLYQNWTFNLLKISEIQSGEERRLTLLSAIAIAKKTIELGGGSYNLACAYALLEDKENALKVLKETLKKKEITVEHVSHDEDWTNYFGDEDFNAVINNYDKE